MVPGLFIKRIVFSAAENLSSLPESLGIYPKENAKYRNFKSVMQRKATFDKFFGKDLRGFHRDNLHLMWEAGMKVLIIVFKDLILV